MHADVLPRVCSFLVVAAVVAACNTDDIAVPTQQLSRVPVADADFTVNKAEFKLVATSYPDLALTAATDGSNVLVPFSSGDTVKAKLVTLTGTVLSSISTHRTGELIAVAFDGTRYLMAWWNVGGGTPGVFGQFVTRAGAASGAVFRMTQTADNVLGLAYAGGKYLVFFRAQPNGTAQGCYARFVQPNGTLGTTITVAAHCGGDNVPYCLATSGTNFVAVYMDTLKSKLYARSISTTGTLGTAVLVAQGLKGDPAAIAYANGKYLVAYNKYVSSTAKNPMVHLLTASGAMTGSALTLVSDSKWHIVAQVIPYGTQFLVGYLNWFPSGNDAVSLRFVHTDGTMSPAWTVLTKNTTTGKIPVPFGVKVGTKVFYAVNRGIVNLSQYKEFDAMTGWDIDGFVFTP